MKRITESATDSGEIEFWATEPERMGGDDDEWGIKLFASKTAYLVTLVYAGQEAAEEAFSLLPLILKDCTFIATVES